MEVNFPGAFSKTDWISRAGIMPKLSVSRRVSFSFENNITTRLVIESEDTRDPPLRFIWGEPLMDGVPDPEEVGFAKPARGAKTRASAARRETTFLECKWAYIFTFLVDVAGTGMTKPFLKRGQLLVGCPFRKGFGQITNEGRAYSKRVTRNIIADLAGNETIPAVNFSEIMGSVLI